MINGLFQEIKQFYGERLKYIVLYGSYARGSFNDESDIDLLIVLESMKSTVAEIGNLTSLKLDLMLESEKYISTSPVTQYNYEHSQMPFYKNVRREGVRL